MLNLLLTVATVLLLGGLALYAHTLMHRQGIILLVTLVAALTVLLQLDFGVIFVPFNGLSMRVTATSIVPVLIMIIMTVYITNGGAMTRLFIIAIFGVSFVSLGFGFINFMHLLSPSSVNRSLFDFSDVYGLNPITLIASLIAFALDFGICTVGYQWLHNQLQGVPRSVIVALVFVFTISVDALFFRVVYDNMSPMFADRLLGDLIGKWIGALPLIPLMIVYLNRVAPRLPGYVGVGERSALDVFAGSYSAIRDKLLKVERDLEAAEIERKQQAAYLEQIVETANEALWLGDPVTNTPLYVNSAYLRTWGRDLAEFVANDQVFINSVVKDDRERMPNFKEIAERGFVETEFRIQRPDGEIRWLRERAFAVKDAAGKVYRVGGVTEDITDRHASEEHQRELLIEREKLQVLRDVIADATHDLKAPLSSINLKMYALQRLRDPEKQQQTLDELGNITKRMANMIDDVLTLARLDNTQEADRQPHNLGAVIAGVEQVMRPLAEARGIALVVELPTNPLIIHLDRDDIERAIGNLVDNALHYSRPEGGQVIIRVAETDAFACVDVVDNGIGIPPEAQEHIFTRFYRAENARSVDPAGTGLGLAIAQKIIEQHAGQIDVISTVGVGTTFRVRLPNPTSE